jgi:hypothetical protein
MQSLVFISSGFLPLPTSFYALPAVICLSFYSLILLLLLSLGILAYWHNWPSCILCLYTTSQCYIHFIHFAIFWKCQIVVVPYPKKQQEWCHLCEYFPVYSVKSCPSVDSLSTFLLALCQIVIGCICFVYFSEWESFPNFYISSAQPTLVSRSWASGFFSCNYSPCISIPQFAFLLLVFAILWWKGLGERSRLM